VKLENLPEYSSVPIYKKHNILNRTFMRERERERERAITGCWRDISNRLGLRVIFLSMAACLRKYFCA
jgi:hypothetical protein